MTTIAIVISSILVWQLLVTIVCVVTNENEEITLNMAMGFWVLVACVISFLMKSIRLWFYQSNYDAYTLYSEDLKHHYIRYMTKKTASLFKQIERESTPIEYHVQMLRAGKEFKSCPSKERILTSKNMFNSNEDFIRKCLKGD